MIAEATGMSVSSVPVTIGRLRRRMADANYERDSSEPLHKRGYRLTAEGRALLSAQPADELATEADHEA